MTRPAVTLSREMKILLTALGLVALLGGWMVLNNRQADTTVVEPPVTAAKPNPADGSGTTVAPNASNGSAQGSTDTGTATPGQQGSTSTSGSGSVQLGTDGRTEVATVPPFPVTGPNGTTPDPTVVAAVPRGINPNQPLNSLNGHNPFSPVRIETQGNTPAGSLATTPPASASGSSTSGDNVTITRPSTPPSGINAAINNPSTGALPISPIAGADTSPTFGGSSESGSSVGSTGSSATGSRPSGSTTVTTSGGAFPPPTIPGAPAGNGVTVIGASNPPAKSGTLPTTTIRPGAGASNSSNSSGANGPTGSAGTGRGPTSAPVAVAPVRPPVAGVREPGTVNVPSASVPGTASGGKDGAATAGITPSGSLSDPSVMTDLGAGGAEAAPGISTLEASINEHQLVFDAAVLGPVNTAVFRSDKGYVVATVGDTIPNTNIILKEVTANSATLAVGNDKKILELDKR